MFSFCHGDWLCTNYGENRGEDRLDLFMPEILKLRNRVYWARSERLSFGDNRSSCRYLGDATILRNAGIVTDDHSIQGRAEYVLNGLQRSRVMGVVLRSSGTTVDLEESFNTNVEIFNRLVSRRLLR